MAKMLPLGVYVAIRPIEKDTGIFIVAESEKGEPEFGIVESIGEQVESELLKVGQTVYFKKYSPEKFEVDGDELYLIEEQELMGIFVE